LKISICIDVSSKQVAIPFYTQALGFEFVNENDEYVQLSANGQTIYLGEKSQGSNPLIEGEAVRNFDRHWTPVHLDISVDDITKCIGQILKLGGKVEGEKNGDWGSIAFCADPFGNGFCIMQLNE